MLTISISGSSSLVSSAASSRTTATADPLAGSVSASSASGSFVILQTPYVRWHIPCGAQITGVAGDEFQLRVSLNGNGSYYQTIQASIKTLGLEKSQMMMFQALSELRRIASVPESLSDGAIASPKILLLCEQVEEAVAGGHKVVIFFNFIAGIELVGERLTELGIDYTTMTGSTRDRRAVVERFQNDPNCRALLMTLKTGGVGLNLTIADTVYIFEPWWNKAAEEQAINRLHRIGQKAKVLSFALITRDTIEEKIRLLQQQKQDLADSLITGDAAITKRLTEEDIKYIFGN